MARFVLALIMLFVPTVGLATLGSPGQLEDPRAAYAAAMPDDDVTRLQHRIDSGQVTLAYDSKAGYLPAVLKALHIPVSSQTLVFSRTSAQKELISPQTPRALYFNDNAYVGYLPEAKALEVAAEDPRLGPVYYVLLQKQTQKPLFFRTVEPCLKCHATKLSHYVPENLLRSVYPRADGEPDVTAKSYVTTGDSPLSERWGGWYVTGTHGSQRHMGNICAERRNAIISLERDKGANITDLRGRLDTASYLSPHSDIVALMVLAHQTHLQNLITEAGYRTRAALREEQAAGNAVNAWKNGHARGMLNTVKASCEPLVKALLCQGEPFLSAPITGTSGFAGEFAAGGPHDNKNRSLRQLDLRHRLFRYPCSYTIYSDAFDALPDIAREYVYGRLRVVLSGRDHGKEFAKLSPIDRKAIRAILMQTKPAYAARENSRQ